MTDPKSHSDWEELKTGYFCSISQTLKNKILRFFKSLNDIIDV